MRAIKCLISVMLVMSLTACASLTDSQKGAGLGAAAGGALGYVVTGGPLGTLGGAALGGVLGAEHVR